jgi:putative hydrolase of the HAD superfamily
MQQDKERSTLAGPDFRHVNAWLFDLDNTLYPAACALFDQIEARMTAFVQQRFALGFEEARRLQKAYYREHGTTLNGLMREHGVDPDLYLDFVHDIDLSVLAVDDALAAALLRLPGRRFVFTNGCRRHATRVLQRLAVAHLFDEVWDIRTIGFRPKPDAQSYRAVLDRAGIEARKSAMFEDMARNLVPAHALGMTTVLIRNESPWSKQGPNHPIATREHIHYETDDLAGFLNAVVTAENHQSKSVMAGRPEPPR